MSDETVSVPREYGVVERGFIPSADTPQKRGAIPTVTLRFGVEEFDARDRLFNALSATPQPNAVPLDDGSLRKLFKSATGYTPEEYEQMLREVKP